MVILNRSVQEVCNKVILLLLFGASAARLVEIPCGEVKAVCRLGEHTWRWATQAQHEKLNKYLSHCTASFGNN